jgi:hypothetical protein
VLHPCVLKPGKTPRWKGGYVGLFASPTTRYRNSYYQMNSQFYIKEQNNMLYLRIIGSGRWRGR